MNGCAATRSPPARAAIARPHATNRTLCARAAASDDAIPGLSYNRLLLAVLDNNPYLNDATRQVRRRSALRFSVDSMTAFKMQYRVYALFKAELALQHPGA